MAELELGHVQLDELFKERQNVSLNGRLGNFKRYGSE
jgi:hypothetical protein